jgi:hypothetical protein
LGCEIYEGSKNNYTAFVPITGVKKFEGPGGGSVRAVIRNTQSKMSSVIQSNVVEENDVEEPDVDDFDSPNVFPYKKCSVCSERSSCGNYNEDKEWFCENCGEDAEIHQCGVCEETQVKGYSTCCEDCGLMTCKDCLKIYSGICCRCAED